MLLYGMEEVTVQCPYCFQVVGLDVDYETRGQMVQDCDVCCRPWLVTVHRDEDGRPVVMVQRS